MSESRPESARLAASRAAFEARLADLQGAIESEVGWAPRAAGWLVPLVALAAGVVLGGAVRRALPARGSRSKRRS